jgi:AAA+ superfamily predicted ATPase
MFDEADHGSDYVANLRKNMTDKSTKFIFLYSCSTVDKMDSFREYRWIKGNVPHIFDLDLVPEHDIFKSMLGNILDERFKKKMEIEGGLDGVYCRILERQVDGGNRKAKEESLKEAFSKIYRRQFDRVVEERQNGKNPDECLITKEDIIGPRPTDALNASKAWKEMMEMIGMDSVKASLRSFASLARLNHERKLHDLPPLRTALNRVFLGPPGTGKTTVAKLYGQILADLGMLSSGKIIFKKASDLIGQYVGQSEEFVKSALKKAQGKVLVIDEAYMLYPGKRSGDSSGGDVYRVAVIDTLVAEIQNVPGEDLCVILIGYTEPMKEMLQCANPGLARRFPIDDAFEFENFSMEQLTRVLELKIDGQKLELTEKAKEVALRVLETARDRPNFGNGGEVDNLLSRAIINQQRRISDDSSVDIFTAMKLRPEDFDPDFDRHSGYEARSKETFKDFVGREDIIAKFDGYQKTIQGMRLHGINPRSHDLIPLNFLFKGPPGTGKTTMARKIGQIFYNMGYLSSSEVVECSVSDLIGQYVGHTGPKVIALLERALGKVLFVDEAYRLAEGRFASEAVNELIDCVTKERFANKLVIILAGYADNMDKLKNINPGFASRFATEIVFEHLSPEHCLILLQRSIAEFGIRIEGVERDTLEGKIRDKSHKSLCRLFAGLMETPSWGNGRDVKTLARSVVHRVFSSCSTVDTVGKSLTISSLDVQAIMQQMLVDKRREAQAMMR